MLLDVKNLTTRFHTHDGEVCAVNDLSLSVEAGECLGIVGESGSGKTQVFLSIMGLLAKNGHVEGEVYFNQQQLIGLSPQELNKLRGGGVLYDFSGSDDLPESLPANFPANDRGTCRASGYFNGRGISKVD